ncbi:Na+/H+ antiporter NhaA [Arthrobacter castelli]|uniref:Na+/H+ antiporter NhaA n=1 Tax=Arthrobacter castelli TaxID=271431 RepID=UPI00040BEFA2|nr:Na+/H+ antiporter NhaA [Arthrobacter castelli]
MAHTDDGRKPVLSRSSYSETVRISEILRKETVGGALLLVAAVAALIWANSPASDSYFALRDFSFGPESLHLNLSVGAWAADGLLAIFFFLAGLELKREMVAGDLRRFSKAIVPVAAAFGGVALPAIIYAVINLSSGAEALRGWAIPTATDIAFAVAVLAVISTHLPSALRLFLLTLAVVDDLIAITIIAFFYTSDLAPMFLGLAIIPLGLFTLLVQKRVRSWYLLIPLAVITWGLVHASGVHATVAGVLLGFTVPVLRADKNLRPNAGPGLAEHFEHRWRPFSSGVAVPVFAFFSAGVAVGGWDGITSAWTDTITLGIIVGLFVGKTIGVLGSTWIVTKTTHATLDKSFKWIDVMGISMLAGVGFTVSLLVAKLSFDPGSLATDHAKVGILTGSLVSALLATVVLKARDRRYRKIREEETRDADQSGKPDVWESGGGTP